MKQALAIAAGALIGLLLAGIISPPIILILPSRLRSAGVVWSTTAMVVALTAAAFWFLATRAKRK